MLEQIIRDFLSAKQNQKGVSSHLHADTSISFTCQYATYGISYLTMLANGNQTGQGIYPAVYYYRQYKKIFVVYGESKRRPPKTWGRFLEASSGQALPIRAYFSPEEIATLERTQYNYLDNYAKAVFELPGGGLEGLDIDAIAFALEEVILEYDAIFKTIAENSTHPSQTEEQQEIVAASGNIIKVNAFAGTGKTSTLVAFATARPGKRILYLAFNRAICAEATMKFPSNVMPRTAHALAYNELKSRYHLHSRGYRPTEVANFLEINDLNLAQQVSALLTYFFNSAEPEITKELFEQFQAQPNQQKLPEAEAENIFSLANTLFNKMETGEVKGTFDFFLKIYQLSNPVLPHDIILFDEAQDASPVMLDIVLKQHNAQKVFVGDRHQQIYSFRYAVNALDSLPDAEEFALTASFRFGPNIAAAASRLIKQYKKEKRSIDGRNKKSEDRIGQVKQDAQYAFISRTNGSLFDMAARLRSDKKLYFVKEFGAIFQDLRDLYYLYLDEHGRITNPYIRHFETYQRLKSFASDTDDKELKSLCKIVEQYKSSFLQTYNEIQANTASTTQETSDIILSTAHTSKGLEFEQVILADDFIDLERLKPEEHDKPETQEEINILYVAMTRAQSVLQLPDSVRKLIPNLNAQAAAPPHFEPDSGNTEVLQGLIEDFITSKADRKRKIRYASESPAINFEVEISPCPRGIAYLTMLAYGNESGFGIYPALYYYRAQQKLFVVYGQSKATPAITWESLFAGLPEPPKAIEKQLKNTDIEDIKQQQPSFNYLDNAAAKMFDLQMTGEKSETYKAIASELTEVIRQYAQLYSLQTSDDFESAKVHKTLAYGVKVRSKSEVIIANMLYERKIPFEYEKPLVDADAGQYLPDFTITVGNKTYYWEHLGMLEVKEYRDHWDVKQAWYERNFPGQLITTEESSELSINADSIITGMLS